MNVALWIVQGLLAVVFAASGSVKVIASKPWLVASGQTGVTHYSLAFIRFVAVAELLGAIGLVAPWRLGIAPSLTPLAAGCLAVLMVGAARAHAGLANEHAGDRARRRKELANASTNAALVAMCLVVIVGRGLSLLD